MKYIKMFEEAKIRWYNKGKWEEEDEVDTFNREIIHNEDFTNFLIKHDAYENYIRNVKEYEKKHPQKYIKNVRVLISSAFIWCETPEDDVYWDRLNDLWRAFLDKINESAKVRWYNKGKLEKIEDVDDDIVDDIGDLYVNWIEGNLYDIVELIDDKYHIFNDTEYRYSNIPTGNNIIPYERINIDYWFYLCNYNHIFNGIKINNDNDWIRVKYIDLPDEIKNRFNKE